MKTAEVKNSTGSSKSSKPFFNKSGEGTFFAQKKETDAPFFQPTLIQPALAVGAPNDPFEQEADKVGRQVMDNFGQASSIQTKLSGLGLQTSLIQPMPIGTRISRMVKHGQNMAQTKCDSCEEEEMMAQPKSLGIQFAGEGGMVSSTIEQRINSQRGGGSSMDAQTKGAMESSFGADFSSVKIHTGAPAVQMSQELNAHAFTVGSDIFFNKGRYRPKTKEGAGLLAHELTHTVQQGASVQNKRISKNPLSKILLRHSLGHLSSMNTKTLYHKEIAQLKEKTPELDKVQKKSGGLCLQSCSKKVRTPCTTAETQTINGDKQVASGWISTALPKLRASPTRADVLASLQTNFGPTDGVAANLPDIISKIVTVSTELTTVPIYCAGTENSTCAKGPCGFTSTAGAHEFVICRNSTLASSNTTYRSACTLHESFHSAFSSFDHDSYSGWNGNSSSSSDYPGSDPLTNADSYTTLILDLK